MKNTAAFALLALCLVGCTSKSGETPSSATSPSATPTGVIATAEVHDAICGHVLKEVGHCGNYVKLDGAYVVLRYPSLGKMEYCGAGEKGAKVEITGKLENGEFVAATYRRVE